MSFLTSSKMNIESTVVNVVVNAFLSGLCIRVSKYGADKLFVNRNGESKHFHVVHISENLTSTEVMTKADVIKFLNDCIAGGIHPKSVTFSFFVSSDADALLAEIEAKYR